MLNYLAWASLLGLAQILLAAWAVASQRKGGLQWSAGARDEPPPPPTGIPARLDRARANFLETFPFFAAAVLLAQATGEAGGWAAFGAALYFWSRVAYLPLYAMGVPYIRSAAWGAATGGIMMILAAVLG